MNPVDPLAGQIGERRNVLFGLQQAHLQTPHLACQKACQEIGASICGRNRA